MYKKLFLALALLLIMGIIFKKPEALPISQIIHEARPSVVSIVATQNLPLYKDQPSNPSFYFYLSQVQSDRDENGVIKRENRTIGRGTGFVVTEEGLIATNHHVVANESADYSVILNDGTTYSAEVLSRDADSDLAVLKLQTGLPNALKFPALKLGNSKKVHVGQSVIAIDYRSTETVGVIHATGRSIVAGNLFGDQNLANLIETDIPITPGSSGSPLVNHYGEVIGINTAFDVAAPPIGFAVPINELKSLLKLLARTP